MQSPSASLKALRLPASFKSKPLRLIFQSLEEKNFKADGGPYFERLNQS